MNHEQAQALLPWHVAATLDSDQAQAVAGHVLDCEQCSADIDLFAGVRQVSEQEQAGEPVYRPQLLENVMAQLSSIPQDEVLPEEDVYRSAPQAGARQQQEPKQSLTRWVSQGMRQFAGQFGWAATPVAAKWVMCAQGALLIGLLGLHASNDTGDADQEFVTVAGPTVTVGTADFVIAFKPGIAESDMRQLLLRSSASLVAGPNAVGLYRIALPKDADRAAIERDLRTSEWIIYLETVDKQ